MKVAKYTVYHVLKRFKELGTSEDRPRSGSPCIAWSKKMIKAVQERVRRNPKRSATWMWVWCQWEELLKHISSWLHTRWERDNTSHLFKIKKILGREKIILRDLKAGTAEWEIFFSNEIKLKIEASVNNRNNRVYTKYSAFGNEFVRTVYCRNSRAVFTFGMGCSLHILEVTSDFRRTGEWKQHRHLH